MVTGCHPAQVLQRGVMGAYPAAGTGEGGDAPEPLGWGYFGPDRRAGGRWARPASQECSIETIS